MLLTPQNRYGVTQALTLAVWPKIGWALVGGLRRYRGIKVEDLGRAMAIDDHTLRTISAGSFFYATLLAIEGTGLWLERRWGEYFTIIITGSFIPMEVFETVRRPGLLRIAITAINIAAVAYLVARLRRETRRQEMLKARSAKDPLS